MNVMNDFINDFKEIAFLVNLVIVHELMVQGKGCFWTKTKLCDDHMYIDVHVYVNTIT